jgi:hypothetical protein
MAGAAWLVKVELAAHLALEGFALYLAEVAAGMTVALVIFYFACRLLRVEEMDEALNALGGRFRRGLKRGESSRP